jgi:hypothetical protein
MFFMLKFEWRRIYTNKRNLSIFLLITLTSLYFVYSGIAEYKRYQAENEIFKDYEKSKVPHFLNYSQYADLGYRILLEPSPLIIFFKNSNVLYNIESNVDTKELIRIYARFKGKKLFVDRGYFKDFSGFVFLVCSLFMIYMGIIGLKNAEYLKFNLMFINFKKLVLFGTLARLFLLNVFFIALPLGAFFLVKMQGIHFPRQAANHFFHYTLFLIITLVFFYLAGMLLAVLFKFRKVVFLWMFVFWVVFMFLVPEFSRVFIFDKAGALPSNESFNLKQLKVLLTFEHNAQKYFTIYPPPKDTDMDQIFRKVTTDFLDNVHRSSKTQELNLNNDIKNIIHSYEYISALFPTQFYYFLAGEISSKGYYGYTDFTDYVIKSQEKFVRYYINKKYVLKEKKVESFVKGDENVFRAQSHLPNVFWPGVMVAVCYCLAMFIIAYFRLKRLLYES